MGYVAQDVYLFAGITGDFSPNHVDEAYMRKTPYGRRIAHGALAVGEQREQHQLHRLSLADDRLLDGVGHRGRQLLDGDACLRLVGHSCSSRSIAAGALLANIVSIVLLVVETVSYRRR